jgi:hypothetical protein
MFREERDPEWTYLLQWKRIGKRRSVQSGVIVYGMSTHPVSGGLKGEKE